MKAEAEVLKHKGDCDYHLDQYIWECSCGVYTEDEKEEMKPKWMKKDTDQ